MPHGGYVTSIFQRVVQLHFETTLQQQNQPHSIILHLDFLRRTEVGHATFKVTDVKLGRQTTTIHVTLSQKGRDEVTAYITNSNLLTETGVSFPTAWRLNPSPASADVSKFEADTDELWAERRAWPFSSFRQACTHIRSWFPRSGQPGRAIVDQWLCLRNGEKFTNESLGYVADMFPQVIESYRSDGEDPYSIDLQQRMSIGEQEKKISNPGFWYPTLVLNLDVKKALPAEGAKWLFARIQAKTIKNGRYDLEVIISDESGDVVALSHHVCFAVSAARNLAQRRPAEQGKL